MRVLPTAVLLVLAGCAALPTERAAALHGVVLAPDAVTAAETARLFDEIAPRLLALDAGLVRRPLEIWVYDELDDEHVYGGFDAPHGRVLLEAVRRHPGFTLAHELVHAYEPESWSALPAVVREGLADWLAARAVPEVAPEMRASRAVSLASWAVGGLPYPVEDASGAVVLLRLGVPVESDLTPAQALAIPQGEIRAARDAQTLKALYGLGLLVVSRAGLEPLVRLSEEARAAGRERVAPQRILEAAGLSPEKEAWLPAIQGLVRGRDEEAALRRILHVPPAPGVEGAAEPSDVRD